MEGEEKAGGGGKSSKEQEEQWKMGGEGEEQSRVEVGGRGAG